MLRELPCRTFRTLLAATLLLAADSGLRGGDPGPDPEAPAAPRRTIGRGATLHGTNGLAFDSRDRLYVASGAGNEIVVLDPDSGEILERLGRERGVEGPLDLVVTPGGDVYYVGAFSGNVIRIPTQGERAAQRVAGDLDGFGASRDGRLFASPLLSSSGVFEIDPQLRDAPRVVLPAGAATEALDAFDFGPDGLLYAPQIFLGRIVRLDVDAMSPNPEVVAEGLRLPVAVKFDAEGRGHVLDQGTGEVLRFDTATGETTVVATVAPGIDNLAFDSRGRLFVSSAWDGFLVEVLPGGEIRTVLDGGMIAPGGVAVLPADPQGADSSAETVFVADAFVLRSFQEPGGEERGLPLFPASAQTVAADGARLLITTWFANSVFVLDPATATVVERYEGYPVPINAIRFRDSLVVADAGTGTPRVTLRSPSGELTVLAAADGERVFFPAGLAATTDALWFADWGSGLVWQVARDGAPIAPELVASGLLQPEGMAADGRGRLLVVEAGACRISSIDLATGATAVVADGLRIGAPAPEGAPPTWAFNGVAVGAAGAVYVTSDIENVIYRIDVTGEPPPVTLGDVDLDGGLDRDDALAILEHVFLGRTLACPAAADFNEDGAVDVSDAIAVLLHAFGIAEPALQATVLCSVSL